MRVGGQCSAAGQFQLSRHELRLRVRLLMMPGARFTVATLRNALALAEMKTAGAHQLRSAFEKMALNFVTSLDGVGFVARPLTTDKECEFRLFRRVWSLVPAGFAASEYRLLCSCF